MLASSSVAPERASRNECTTTAANAGASTAHHSSKVKMDANVAVAEAEATCSCRAGPPMRMEKD